MTQSDNISRFKCRICLGETNHRILFHQSLTKHHPYDDYAAEQYGASAAEVDEYTLLQCCGCDDIRLLVKHSEECFSNSFDYSSVYPPDQIRRIPEWVYFDLRMTPNLFGQPEAKPGRREHLAELQNILVEIYQALGVGSHRLAMMGIRALVERIMIFEVSDLHSFEKNIQAFFDKGFVALIQQDMFRNALIEAGHAAMHRGWEPKRDDIMTLLDIVESLIKSLYIDNKKAADLASRITPRVPKILKKPPVSE